MDPIIVEVTTPEAFPFDLLFTALTALIVAIASGFGGYWISSRLQSRQIAHEKESDRVDNIVSVREQTILPYRNSFAALQDAFVTFVSAESSGYQNDVLRAMLVGAFSEFRKGYLVLTDPILIEASGEVDDLIKEMFADYLNSDASKSAAQDLSRKIASLEPKTTLLRNRINERVEFLLQGRDVE